MQHIHEAMIMTKFDRRGLRLAVACCLGVPLLQACGPLTLRDEQTGAWVPIQAAALEVHRDIAIPSGRARTFFQNGKQVSHINEFKSFCQLEISTLQEHVQTVNPDRFTVTRVGRSMEEIVEARSITLAALDNFILARGVGSDGNDGGPTRITQMFRFHLHSDRQPDVRSVSCGGAFDEPADADAPTVQEIAADLGDYATLVLQ